MLSLNYRDGRPIYEQVRDGLRRLVVTGAMQSGEKLPSVRTMATTLAINPNTIQRAYEALEGEGYLYTIVGKGSYVANHGDIQDVRRQTLLEQLDRTAVELSYLGMSMEELSQRIGVALDRMREEEVHHD